MRSIPANIDHLLQNNLPRSERFRVRVDDGGGTFRDLSDLEGRGWGLGLEYNFDLDEGVGDAQVYLIREDNELSLSPLKTKSLLNRLTGSFSPLLEEGRAVKIDLAVGPVGGEIEWVPLLHGEIHSVDWEPDIVLSCLDEAGRLNRTWIEEEEERGAEFPPGQDVRDLIQDILDEWANGVVLYTPVDPEWSVAPYVQEKMSVWQALRNIVAEFGWVIGCLWDEGEGEFRLTLYDPERTKTTPDRIFSSSSYLDVERIRRSIEDIRNAVKVTFSDHEGDPDSEGEYPRENVVATDAASIDKYGRMYMEMALEASAQINTFDQAWRLANAAKDDLAEPKLEQAIILPLFPFAEPTDLYEFEANGIHYDENKAGAVMTLTHSCREGAGRTTLGLREKPASMHRGWLERGAGPGIARPIKDFRPKIAAPTLTPIAGGIRATIPLHDIDPKLRARLDRFEIHIGEGDFTPNINTLVASGRDRAFSLAGDLLPVGEDVSVRVVGVDRFGIKSTISAHEEGKVGQMGSHLLTPSALGVGVWTGGTFEDSSRGESYPPDRWRMIQGAWREDGQGKVERDGAIAETGRSVLGLRSSPDLWNPPWNVNGIVRSDPVLVKEGRSYMMDCPCYLNHMDDELTVTIRGYDAEDNESASPLVSFSRDGTDGLETWLMNREVFSTKDAHYIRFEIEAGGEASSWMFIDRVALDEFAPIMRVYLGEPYTMDTSEGSERVEFDEEDFAFGMSWDFEEHETNIPNLGLWRVSGMLAVSPYWTEVGDPNSTISVEVKTESQTLFSQEQTGATLMAFQWDLKSPLFPEKLWVTVTVSDAPGAPSIALGNIELDCVRI